MTAALESMRYISSSEYEVSFSDFISPFVPHIVDLLDSSAPEHCASAQGLCRQVFDRLSGGSNILEIDRNEHHVIRSLKRYQASEKSDLTFEEFQQGILQDFHAIHSL